MALQKIKELFNSSFWKITNNSNDGLHCIETEYATPFVNIKDNIFDEHTAYIFHRNNGASVNGYFYRMDKPCVIEPSLGYAITGFNKIIAPSIFTYAIKPATGKYLRYKLLNAGKELQLDKAVLFDGQLGANYFHFFADVLSKLWLLEKHHFDKSVPLVISKKTFDTRYFQYFYKNTEIKNLKWLVQNEGVFIKCKQLYLPNPAPYNKSFWGRTINLVENLKSSNPSSRRLFLTRPAIYRRTISNINSLLPILEQYKFEIVDTGQLTFEEQVKLFSEAGIIAGVHGAAFTNLIFSRTQNLRVLEVMPAERTSGQLYWLAALLGVKYYDCVLGGPIINSNYEVSVEAFGQAISRLTADVD